MTPRRKVHCLTVMVSAPAAMAKREVRREIRSLVNHQANWSAEPGDIKARSIR